MCFIEWCNQNMVLYLSFCQSLDFYSVLLQLLSPFTQRVCLIKRNYSLGRLFCLASAKFPYEELR